MTLVAEQTLAAPEFSSERAAKYLQIYNTDMDWMPFIGDLFQKLKKKNGEELAKQQIRKQIAFTILFPLQDPHVIKDPPQRLLFGCPAFTEFEPRDWAGELLEVWEKDDKIAVVRNKALEMGIIMPFDYVPIARQAYRWLMERVEASLPNIVGTPKHEDIKKKMQNLVYAYGGAVICNTFMKPEYKNKIDKIHNWRSGYFFEKLIFEVYKEKEILKIKEHELNKVDKNLVKKIRN